MWCRCLNRTIGSGFEIHCYASVSRPDAITDRLRQAAHFWHDVRLRTNEELAALIRQNGIDILVDLTMHMAHNRLLVFARKPAPVQVTWLAYPGSTGLETIDYRITDSHMDAPDGNELIYAEKSVRLPDCWCCYDPLTDLPPATPRPRSWNGPIYFGCLNNPCKINAPVLRLWADVLRAVQHSHLLIMASSAQQRRWIGNLLGQSGVRSDRVEFVGSCARCDYLRIYDRIDIALDPLPYNGITTTCDALWMGVPVVSLAGETAAGRAGRSILSNIGLTDLIAQTPEQYIQLAANLAHDLPRLATLRSTLRDRMQKSPLMDAPRFAHNIEFAYRTMWREWGAKGYTG